MLHLLLITKFNLNFVTLPNQEPMETQNPIARNLKLYREKLGISQESLANYLGVSRGEINYYENDKRAVPTKVIEKAAKLFGIDEYDLYNEDTENLQANIAFAFRADYLTTEDLETIADFRKIVLNYLKMTKALYNE